MKSQVKDWMTTQVVTVSPTTVLPEVEKLMADKHIRHLPVVDHDHLVGIVTWGDVRGAESSKATLLSAAELNYLLARVTISHIMTRTPMTVPQNAPIDEAARLMMTKKIGGLPVVDDTGHLVGIITESDILRMVAQQRSVN
jgi:CBS domain-containing protein